MIGLVSGILLRRRKYVEHPYSRSLCHSDGLSRTASENRRIVVRNDRRRMVDHELISLLHAGIRRHFIDVRHTACHSFDSRVLSDRALRIKARSADPSLGLIPARQREDESDIPDTTRGAEYSLCGKCIESECASADEKSVPVPVQKRYGAFGRDSDEIGMISRNFTVSCKTA